MKCAIGFFAILVAVTAELDVQSFLTNYGYYNPHAFNGDSDLTTAIKSYQRFFHLNETGIVDDATKEEMQRPRCGNPDHQNLGYYSSKWREMHLNYYFRNTGRDLDSGTVRATVKRAFDAWASLTPLTFTETSRSGKIHLGFETGRHNDNSAFDRAGGVLAHAYFPPNGRLCFDESEHWGVNGKGTDLYEIALHEIGHILGLDHSNVRGSVMWPSYNGYRPNLQLQRDDVYRIQRLYGKGSGTGTGTECVNISSESKCQEQRPYCGNNEFVKQRCQKTCGICT